MVFSALSLFWGCRHGQPATDDFRKLAFSERKHLRLATYMTAHTVEQMFRTEAGRREVLSLLNCYGISKVYFEVYRSGLVVPPDLIRSGVSFLEENGFEVVGGIATVPGENFGKGQEGPLEWFNWQNRKTQDDLRKVMEESAPFFDSFIVDDFLCTSDTSMESKSEKGDRSWSEYRRSLLTSCAANVLIDPARKANPSIKMIIKYPQWYDRFHLFGYDPPAETALFDGIWVGTESRGQYTQRFGFVQPYEGFINYRWLSSIAGRKTGGAWFDHEDCTGQDFLYQAYQSVLAGAKELIIFSFDSFINGHPGHHLLMHDFDRLAALASAVAEHPVTGPAGYKPAGSDAGGDLYILDYIGMLGVSLVPVSSYPAGAAVVFLPTQAAADREIYDKIKASLDSGSKVLMTAGFIAAAGEGEKLSALAGIKWPQEEGSWQYETIIEGGRKEKLPVPLKTGYRIVPAGAEVLLSVKGKVEDPFLTRNTTGNIYVINTHTFSQADFDEAGELLLCPRQLALTGLPGAAVNVIRDAFSGKDAPVTDAPARVTAQSLQGAGLVLQNYNPVEVTVGIRAGTRYVDGFTGAPVESTGEGLLLKMDPASVLWLKPLQ